MALHPFHQVADCSLPALLLQEKVKQQQHRWSMLEPLMARHPSGCLAACRPCPCKKKAKQQQQRWSTLEPLCHHTY
jgi:hypothetical protein